MPDLTEKLANAGMLDEYTKFREGYLVWRAGGTHGADGDLTLGKREKTDIEEELKQMDFEKEERLHAMFSMYGGSNAFNWQKTFSYWVAVLFMIGCNLFVFTCYMECVPEWWPKEWTCTAQAQWIANVFFTAGIVLMWFTIANVKKKTDEPLLWNPCAAATIKAHLAKVYPQEGEPGLFGTNMPYYIAIQYMIGGALYNSVTLAPLVGTLTPTQKLWYSTLPSIIGGFLFFTGGLFEMLGCMYIVKEGTRWWSPARWDILPLDLEKWSTIINMVGGFLFFFPSFLEQFPHHVYRDNEEAKEWWTGFLFTVGSALYVLGCVLQIWMWKGDSFGLSYMHMLNKVNELAAQGSRSKTELKLGFSFRGTTMLFLCTVFCSSSIMNACMHFQALSLEYAQGVRIVTILLKFSRDLFPFILLVLELVLISAAINLPKVQPYRGLMINIRFLTLGLGVYLCLDFIEVYEELMCSSGHSKFCDL